jgi:eukaryotic-like serine/threonine-protein kinase
MDPSQSALQDGVAVDRYEVVHKLGEGGMAAVFLVRHRTLGTLHALKVLTLSSEKVRMRLIREGRVQATLRHPNIVAVTDVLDVHGAPGLLMEYVEGDALDDLLARSGPLDPALAEAVFLDILAGVERAHEMGVIHRDLKPANVMLSPEEGGRVVAKVADFGLAKALEADEGLIRTRTGVAMGTPFYMSPEQIRDARSVDRRTDVFALGAILYELCCGRRAFDGGDLLEIFNAVAGGRFTPPRAIVPELPDRVVSAITGALEVDRERRIPDCGTLRAVLRGQQSWSPTASSGGAATMDGLSFDFSVAPALGPAGSDLGASPTLTPASNASMVPERPTLSPPSAPSIDPPPPTLGPTSGDASHQSASTLGSGSWGHDLEGSLSASVASVASDAMPAPFSAAAGVREGSGSPRRRTTLFALAAAVVMAGGVGLGAGAWLESRESAPPTSAPLAEVDGAAKGPPPTVEPAPAVEAQVAAPEPGSNRARPTPRSVPEVETSAPAIGPATRTPERGSAPPALAAERAPTAREPASKARPTGTIRVVGADQVRLVGEAGSFPPGAVPAGTYRIVASFGSTVVEGAGTATVGAGEVVSVRCDADFLVCER